MDDFQVLNPKQLNKIDQLGGPDLVQKIIDAFLQSTPAKIAVLSVDKHSRTLKEVEFAAHSLKSSAGNLGATELQGLAQDLETSSGLGNEVVVERAIKTLLLSYARTCQALVAERNRTQK
jgi:HPt (histidine-containing phosphotransfer) domain-containing protein